MGRQQVICIISSCRILSQLAGTDLPRSSATLRLSGLSLALQSPPPPLPLLPVETVATGERSALRRGRGPRPPAPGPPLLANVKGERCLASAPVARAPSRHRRKTVGPQGCIGDSLVGNLLCRAKCPLAPTSVRQRGPEGCRYGGGTGNWLRRMGARGDDVR